MNEKRMILIGTGAGGLLLAFLIAAACIIIGNNSRSAALAAEEFAGLLSQGKLTELEARYYLEEEDPDRVIYDETGTAKLQFVTPAGLAERFGAEAVLGTYEPTYEEKGLAALMHVSTLQVTTGTVLGSRTTAALTLTGPDLEAWLSGLEPEEAAQLAGAGEELPQILEELLSKDPIPMRTIRQRIPMQKRDGQWRFAVTEEMEKEWFG